MKSVYRLLGVLACFIFSVQAQETLSEEKMMRLLKQVTHLQNKVLRQGSTVADAEALFSMYTPDFTYIHEKYGGTYTREHLYSNTVKFLKQGRYDYQVDRYKIDSTLIGVNTIAVVRTEHFGDEHDQHLAVFEFDGDQVRRITEYW